MTRATLAVALGTAAVTLLAAAGPAAADGCQIVIELSGTYQGRVEEQVTLLGNKLAPRVEFRIGERIDQQERYDRRNVRQCGSSNLGPGDDISVPANLWGQEAYMLLWHLSRDHAVSPKPGAPAEVQAAYGDMQQLLKAVRGRELAEGWTVIAINAGFEVLSRVFPAGSVASTVLRALSKEIVRQYLVEPDPAKFEAAVQTLVRDEVLKHLTGELSTSLRQEIAKASTKVAKEVDRIFKEQLPTDQSFSVSHEKEGCTYHLYGFWSPRQGTWKLRLTKECGENLGEVASCTFAVNPAAGPPETRIGGSFSCVDSRANPVLVDSVVLASDGGLFDDPPTIAGVGTKTLNGVAGTPKADRAYTLTAEIRAGGKLFTRSQVFTVTNVPPRLDGPIPAWFRVEPGGDLDLKGLSIGVTDDNADSTPAGRSEIVEANVRMEHPGGLGLQPPTTSLACGADCVDSITDPDRNGRQVIRITRPARVHYPHEAGDFKATITVKDDDGESQTVALPVIVENVEPTVESVAVAPATVDPPAAGAPPVPILVDAVARDANGSHDLSFLTIDTRRASEDGRKLYDLRNGDVVRTETSLREDTWPDRVFHDAVAFHLDAPFAASRKPGSYPVQVVAGEAGTPRSAERTGRLTVRNPLPRVTTGGYIYEPSNAATAFLGRKTLCPGDTFLVGGMASDPQGDELKVTATALSVGTPVGPPLELTRKPGEEAFTAVMTAPAAPGEYVIEIRVFEVAGGAEGGTLTLPLTVKDCRTTSGGVLIGVVPVDAEGDLFTPGGIVGKLGGGAQPPPSPRPTAPPSPTGTPSATPTPSPTSTPGPTPTQPPPSPTATPTPTATPQPTPTTPFATPTPSFAVACDIEGTYLGGPGCGAITTTVTRLNQAQICLTLPGNPAAVPFTCDGQQAFATGVVVFNQPNHDCTVLVLTSEGNVVTSFRLSCQEQGTANQCQQVYEK